MNIAVLFGGRSCEHDISIITGVLAANALKARHTVFAIYITNSGDFFYIKQKNININNFLNFDMKKNEKVFFQPNSKYLYNKKGKKIVQIDVAVLANHGINGEDGSLQGYLKLCSIPYTSSNVRASAICMDKITMKQIFKASDLPILDFVGIEKEIYEKSPWETILEIKCKLKFPMIVKPSNLGSSIGINIANTYEELMNDITIAFNWDSRVIVENALEDFKEINIAVMGEGKNIVTSATEEPISWNKFLTFDEKYIVQKSKSDLTKERKVPAEIDIDLEKKIKLLAKKSFQCIGCSGLVRIDFLLKKDDVYINEINTIPGSFSKHLFEEYGMSFLDELENLINIAIKEKEKEDTLTYTYNSNVLKSCKGNKMM